VTALQSWHTLFGLVCGPACLPMVVEMLISFGAYSGRARHPRSAAWTGTAVMVATHQRAGRAAEDSIGTVAPAAEIFG